MKTKPKKTIASFCGSPRNSPVSARRRMNSVSTARIASCGRHVVSRKNVLVVLVLDERPADHIAKGLKTGEHQARYRQQVLGQLARQLRRDAREFEIAAIMLGASDENRFLGAEMAKERRFVDACNVGNFARRRAAFAFASDHLARCRENSLARLLGRRRSAAFSRLTRFDHGVPLPGWIGTLVS